MSLLLKITSILTFCLICLGGYVHNTGSSLACPDWPLCFGQVMPNMVGGVLIEHSHRLLASLVGFFTIINLVLVYRHKESTTKLKKWSWIALALVIFQGVLGGLTVIYRLPSFVSTAHLGTSMVFFGTLIYLHYLVTSTNKPVEIFKSTIPNFKRNFLIVLFLVYGQMILGALIRHLGLGASCGLGYENSVICYDVLAEVKTWFPVSTQAVLHMIHRYFAVLVGLAIIFFSVKMIKQTRKELKSYKLLFSLPIFFVVFQIKLGVLTIGTDLGPLMTTMHLAGAALLFISLFRIFLMTHNQFDSNSNPTKNNSRTKDFLDLTKPKLSALVIFTMALGIWSAPGNINLFQAMIAVLATTMLVGGACAINCYMEKDIDALMKRTQDRPLPAGRMKSKEALYFGYGLIALSLPILYFSSNFLTMVLGIIAAIVYLYIYTPMKTKSGFAVFVGAIPGAIPPLMGWTTVTNEISSMGVVLFTLLFVWQLPHFFAIALYHGEDYENAGIKVIPNEIGDKATAGRIILFTLSLLVLGVFPFVIGHYDSIAFVIANIIIGLIFLKVALEGIGKVDTALKKWARKYFLGSVMYLPVVLLVLIVFR